MGDWSTGHEPEQVFLFTIMAKELPYFKFEPSEWRDGDIQMCSNDAKIAFIEMCCLYWSRLGDLSYRLALVKCCQRTEDIMCELIDEGIIAINNDKIEISFLDRQLEEFENIRKTRKESGRKGGQKGGVRPKQERLFGKQLYFIRCWNDSEEFLKMGTTKNSVSRRYSGKMPYQYELVFQQFIDNNIELENELCEMLRSCEYLPKLNFPGQKECYKMSEYDSISDILKQRTGVALAMLKRNKPIREEESRVEERREEESRVEEKVNTVEVFTEEDFYYTFEDFWKAYGYKMDRAKCEAKFKRLKPDEKELVRQHVPLYVGATPDKQYRKRPLTYLNGKCWLDEELPTQKPSNKTKQENKAIVNLADDYLKQHGITE